METESTTGWGLPLIHEKAVRLLLPSDIHLEFKLAAYKRGMTMAEVLRKAALQFIRESV